MCGIAGMLGVSWELAQGAAPRMLAAMQHRGPDDSGMEILQNSQAPDRPVILLHTRLAILDLTSAGHQPMSDHPADPRQKPNWIVFNGEVFNYQDLHAELAGAGWPCRTRSDTEVILHAYRVWGEKSVERLRGMFTWCLIDTEPIPAKPSGFSFRVDQAPSEHPPKPLHGCLAPDAIGMEDHLRVRASAARPTGSG